MPPSLLYTFPCFPTTFIQKPVALPWPAGGPVCSGPCHPLQFSLPCSSHSGHIKKLEVPCLCYAFFLIHMPLYMASLSSRMSSHSSPTDPLANSHSSIKTMFWYHFLKKASSAYHQPSPQVGLCALTLNLNNSWKWTLLLGHL